MSVLNGEHYLEEAIKSVLDQSLEDFDFIIIDNCSTDRTSSIIKGFNDARIRSYKLKEKVNLSRSLNYGLGKCNSDLVARIDADDLMQQERLEKQVVFMEKNSEVVLLGTAIERIYEDGSYRDIVEYPCIHEEIVSSIVRQNPFAHPSVIYRKNAIKSLGNYSEQYHFAQDFKLWIEVMKRFKVANLREPLTKYRTHPLQNSFKTSKETVEIYEFILSDQILRSRISIDLAKETLTKWKLVPLDEEMSELRKRIWTEWTESLPINSKLALYGGGDHTERLLHEINTLGSKLKPFVILDNSSAREHIKGIPVTRPSCFNFSTADYIVVSSFFYEDEIISDLKKNIQGDKVLSFYIGSDFKN